jgi:hypothetical protein
MSHDVRTEIPARPAGRPGAGRLAAHSGAGLLAGRSGAGPVAAASQRRALAALLGAMFLANVDIAVANIAGPSIRMGLHASGGELELIVSGYTLAYAMLLVISARLGEAHGYRRIFLAGLGGFTVASLACGLAPTPMVLVIARIAAGAAAAFMAAQVLTGIQLSFGGAARARALGLYSVVLSAGAVAGQSLGGLLISADVLGSTWRPAFLVNVPIGVLLIWLAWRWLPVGQGRPGRLDLAGGAVLSAAMLLLVVPLVLGQDAGWPAWTQACLAASVPAFAALWLVERKVSARGGRPLVDPRLIARPEIGWGWLRRRPRPRPISRCCSPSRCTCSRGSAAAPPTQGWRWCRGWRRSASPDRLWAGSRPGYGRWPPQPARSSSPLVSPAWPPACTPATPAGCC